MERITRTAHNSILHRSAGFFFFKYCIRVIENGIMRNCVKLVFRMEMVDRRNRVLSFLKNYFHRNNKALFSRD